MTREQTDTDTAPLEISAATAMGKRGTAGHAVIARFRPDDERWRTVTIAILVAFPFLYGGVSQFLGQDVNWDLQNYHYFDPYWLLVNHMRDILPAQLQTYYSPFLDVPFYDAVNRISPRLLAFLIAVVEGTSFPILYLIGRHFTKSRLIALGLAALGMFTAGAISELGTILGDTLIAPLLLGAVLLGLHSMENDRLRSGMAPLPWLVLAAGGLAGVATGLKPSALPVAFGIIVAISLGSAGVRRRLARLVVGGFGLVVGGLIAYGWWGYELWARYRNPFLPYLNQFFHSAYAPKASNTYIISRSIWTFLLDPVIWTLNPLRVNESNFVELSMLFLELVLVVLVISSAIKAVKEKQRFRLFDNARQRYLMTVVVVSYFAWVIEFGIYRYLIPVEMLSFVAIFICLQAMRTRIPIPEFASVGKQLVIGTMAGIVILSLVTEVPGNLGRTSWTSRTFSATIPADLTASPSAFLMLGLQPNGYVVPLFPSDDFFAQLQGNLPPTPVVKQQIIRTASDYRHKYILWSGSPPHHVSAFEQLLSDGATAKAYGYRVSWNQCASFPSTVGAQIHHFHVCPLTG
jgi:hypothetical protein